MNLEFRIPIAPTKGFYSQVRLAALSLRRLGPPYDSAPILVSVGDCAEETDVRNANRWSTDYPVRWRMVPHDKFRERGYFATGADCLTVPAEADVVIVCNADVCLVNRMDDLMARASLAEGRFVAGLQAHYPPFGMNGSEGEAEWRRIFEAAGLPAPNLNVRYSFDTADAFGYAPPYLNFGLVALNRAAFAAIGPLFEPYTELTRSLLSDRFFHAQIAFSLIVTSAALQVEQLSHDYNCANDPLVFAGPDEVRCHSVDEIRAIHYLRTEQLDRDNFLADRAAYEVFLSNPDLNRVNARLRDHVLALSWHDDPVFPG